MCHKDHAKTPWNRYIKWHAYTNFHLSHRILSLAPSLGPALGSSPWGGGGSSGVAQLAGVELQFSYKVLLHQRLPEDFNGIITKKGWSMRSPFKSVRFWGARGTAYTGQGQCEPDPTAAPESCLVNEYLRNGPGALKLPDIFRCHMSFLDDPPPLNCYFVDFLGTRKFIY